MYSAITAQRVINRRVRYIGRVRHGVDSLEGTVRQLFHNTVLVDWDDQRIPRLVSDMQAILIPSKDRPVPSRVC